MFWSDEKENLNSGLNPKCQVRQKPVNIIATVKRGDGSLGLWGAREWQGQS